MESTEKIQIVGNAQKSIPFDIKKGYYIFWTFTTQAAFTINVELKDNKRIYMVAHRTSISPIPAEQGYAKVEGENLQLVINIPQSYQIDGRIQDMNILDSKSQMIVKTITLVGEDSDDLDYNDIFFNISAWRSEG